ncbi:MAG: PEP-CTERM sorting domain-containing protein [Pseudomonadota bacterium]
MIKRIRFLAFSIAFIALFAGNAQAGLITFNLAGDSGDGAEGAALDGLTVGSVFKDGVTATLQAVSTRPDGIDDVVVLNQTSSAFGTNLLGDGCDDSSEIDNSPACSGNYGESLFVWFDQMVELVSITLTNYSPTDNAEIFFQNSDTQDLFGNLDLPSTPSTLNIGATVGQLGDGFLIESLEGNGFSIDRFTIRAAMAVPLPTTLALFGLGLVGLGFSRRICRPQ